MKNIVILAAVFMVALYYIIAEVIWQLKNRLFRRRLVIGVLIAALLLSQTSIVNLFMRTDAESAAAAEAENAEIITVSAFAELSDDIIEQTVPIGTELSELVLPGTLEAVCVIADADTDTDTDTDADENLEDSSENEDNTEDVTPGEEIDTEDVTPGEETDTEDEAPGEETDTENEAPENAPEDGSQTEETAEEAENANTEEEPSSEGSASEVSEEEYTEEIIVLDTEAFKEYVKKAAMKTETDSFVMPEYYSEHIVEVKTLEADLPAEEADPDTSEVSQETITIENITWQSEPEYDGNVEGEYIFTAVLPEGYVLTNGVNAPQITVTVGETDNIALMSNDGIMLMASNEPPLSGGGTVNNPYKISSEGDLKTLATFVNAGTNAGAGTDNSCSGMYFELTQDITLSGTWTPIGKEVGVNNNSFSGIFDGKNHTISGLNITVSQGQQGLFGVVKEGEIKNLNVKGTITGTNKNYYSVGGVVGYNDLGIIENCSFSGTISVKGDKAGGIAGYNSGNANKTKGIIRNCTASGAVTGTQYVGGILGHNVTGTVQNCYNNCTVEGTYAVGGIVGYNAQTSIVSNSYNTGNVECNGTNSYGSRVGGIAGMNSDSTINNCYNEGTVTGNLDYVGGVAGYNNATATVQNCYNRGTVTGSGDKVGGVIGDSTATNSYYLNTCGAAGTGESKTSAQFTSGEVTWLLQNGQSDFVWGQTLNSNNYPLLVTFTSSAKRVWKVTFMDGSTERVVKYVNDGNTITEPTDVINDGYTAEWYTAQNGGGSKYNFSNAVKADLTLYVNWVENKCTVTFDANGGSVTPTTKEYKIGETYDTLPTPTRTGYTFDAWYTTATGGTKITATSIVSKDVTRLYAHWKANEYNITYKDQGDATFSGTHASGYPTKHTYGTATTLKSASKTGYTFGGWYTESNCTTKVTSLGASAYTSNITLYAKWTANQYTVSFNSAGGSSVSNITVTYDSTYGDLPETTRDGYAFDGWYTTANGNVKVTSTTKVTTADAHTLYAHWTANTYPATFDANNGSWSGNEEIKTVDQTYDSNWTFPTDPERTGYEFIGWWTEETGGTQVTSATPYTTDGTTTVYAQWKIINYTITYTDAGSDNGGNPSTYTVEDAFTLNNPAARVGYTFAGWGGTGLTGTDNKPVTIPKGSTGARNYTAYWTPITYGITYRDQGDEAFSGTHESGYPESHTYGTATTLKTASKKGYTFKGWYTDSRCTDESKVTELAADRYTEDITLYAKWADETAPVIGELIYNYSTKNVAGYVIGNKNLTITVSVTEEGSGVDEIEYTATAVKGTSKSGTATIEANGTASFTVDADFKGSIIITCADKAKNEGSKTVNVILEKNKSTVSFDIDDSSVSGETVYYEESPDVKVTVTDDADNAISGGIASVTYQIGSGSAQQVTEDFTTTIKEQCSFTIPANKISTGVSVITVKVEDNAGNKGEETLTVKVKGPEETPKAALDEVHVTITGLVPEAEYDITYTDASGQTHTDIVTADENGSLEIEDGWTGGEIEIVKKGNGTETTDSQPQKLEIPERETAPEGLTATDESLKGANDSKIGGLNPEEEYEVSKDGGKTWEKKKANKDGEIEPLAPGGYDVRRPAGEDTLPSKSVHVDVKESNITQEETPEAKLDEVHVTITDLVPEAEYDITYTDADGKTHTDRVTADKDGNLEIEDAWTGGDIEIRKKGNGDNTIDSQPQEGLYIPEREPGISGRPTVTDESLKGANDGKVGGLEPEEEYEVSKDGGKTWEKKKANKDGEIEPLAPGSYEVRRPAGDDTLPSKPTHVDIKGSNITQEETPEASVDRSNGRIKDLVPGAKYDITYTDQDGKQQKDTVTADENGNLEIKDDWLGKSVDIEKKGNGSDSINSDEQTVYIPTREKKPEPKTTKVSAKGKSDGKITNLEPDETYEISKDGGETWETVTANDKGEVTGLPAGDYQIRTKAKDNADGGTLCSEAADCKIGTKSSSTGGGSSESGGGNDSGGGQSGDNGGGQSDDNSGGQSGDNGGQSEDNSGNGQTDDGSEDSVTPPKDTPKKDTPKKGTPKKDESKQDTDKKTEDSGKPEQSTKSDTKSPAETTEQTAPTETSDDAVEITGDPIATGTIKDAQDTTTTITVGEGSVSVTVISDEYSHAAGIKDTVALSNAVLTKEQIRHVNDGGKIEIRVEVKDISDQVPQQDKDIIENGLAGNKITGDIDAQEQGVLTLGAYIDISMFIKIGDGDWDAITHAGEPIDVVIGIPDELQDDSRTFYVARCHEGEYALLPDMDTEAETITIQTELFSTYAIVYSQPGIAGITSGSKCNLCHICPTFLGVCCFIWLAIVIAAVIVVILIVSIRRKNQRNL